MSITTPNSSSSGSQSPPSDLISRQPSPSSSANPSPSSHTSSLTPMAGFAWSEGSDTSVSVGTPSRHTPPAPVPTGRGGCWTCRLRRKKCDETHGPNDSCMTCTRLGLDCLGWGIKRPEWMRDKERVEEYKASIKAQLTRAGLIRGQPRAPTGMQVPGHTRTRSRRPAEFSTSDVAGQSSGPDYLHRPSSSGLHRSQTVQPGSSSLHLLPAASHSDPSVNTLGLDISPAPEDLTFDFSSFASTNIDSPIPQYYHFDSPVGPQLPDQNAMQEIEHVTYYFNYVSRIQYPFGGNDLSNITYSIILEEPRGPVTHSVCALAGLHCARMRVAHGLQLPDEHPEQSMAHYFYQEVLLHLRSRQMTGSYTASDAIAALHIISYSIFYGGSLDWREPLAVACDWVAQTGIILDPAPKIMLLNMTPMERAAVKITLWLDIFSTLPLMRPPKYLAFYKRLFAEPNAPNSFWPNQMTQGTSELLHMETICGCPDNAMIAFAEISALAHWKTVELRNRSLSYPELIARGNAIEQQLRQTPAEPLHFSEFEQAPLHPGQNTPDSTSRIPTEEMRRIVAALFQEAVILYLHTVLSQPQPGVREIATSVEKIIKLLNQLPPSEVDRSLTFVICIAGCMTDASVHRDFLKARLQAQDDSFGNLLQTRAVMEAVWQRRDTNGGIIDWREVMMLEHGLNALLV